MLAKINAAFSNRQTASCYFKHTRNLKKKTNVCVFLRKMIGKVITRQKIYGPVQEISNNLVCATSKASDQPAHTRSLIRAFASRLSIL